MNTITRLLTAAAAVAGAIATPAAAATYTYVGNWYVGDGEVWTNNPAVYSGQEAAALLFGGVASDYAISTIDSNPLNINFSAFVDGWGDDQYLNTPVSQSYSLDLGNPGYNDPAGTGTAYSAFVLDHSCDNRYSNPNEGCTSNVRGLNFAFRINSAVPEPATWAMMLVGFGAVGVAARRRRSTLAAA
jgi:hypothetical protein